MRVYMCIFGAERGSFCQVYGEKVGAYNGVVRYYMQEVGMTDKEADGLRIAVRKEGDGIGGYYADGVVVTSGEFKGSRYVILEIAEGKDVFVGNI